MFSKNYIIGKIKYKLNLHLFYFAEKDKSLNQPLSEIIRPSSLLDFVGQENVVGTNSILRSMIAGSRYNSMILWGPPGCGKVILNFII